MVSQSCCEREKEEVEGETKAEEEGGNEVGGGGGMEGEERPA